MTEAEWLACEDAEPMLRELEEKLSDRKVRLFVCAAAHRVWSSLSEVERKNLDASEEYADGRITLADLKRAWGLAETYEDLLTANAHHAIYPVCGYASRASRKRTSKGGKARLANERAAQANLLRCISGNPFRPMVCDAAWQTPTVMALATAAYEERIAPANTLDNVRLAILADALEEAGCTEEDVLRHCRQAENHVRGCWVLDLLLAKE